MLGIKTKEKNNNNEYKYPEKYAKYLDQCGAFQNKYEDAIAATAVYDAIKKHMDSDDNGKVKKVAFIGFDGVRADCIVPNIKTNYDAHMSTEPFSLIQELADNKGLFISFTGGVKGDLQGTSTPPGWATLLTGVWKSQHGVDWGCVMKKRETVLMEYARQGKKTAFNAIWPTHFKETYSVEIASSKKLGLPIEYYECEDNDDILTQRMIQCVTEKNCDISFCILELPDHVGHGTELGFWKQNPQYINAVEHCDKNAYLISEAIKARPNYNNEDWLIIVSTDHGGHLKGHGEQIHTDRTTFIATNKPELFN